MKYVMFVLLVIGVVGCGEDEFPRQRVDSDQIMIG